MEFRLNLSNYSTRAMPTANSMSDSPIYFGQPPMWQPEKPSKSLWDISIAQQVKFAMPVMPRCDAFGKNSVVGGFVGSKSQRPDKPDLFPIGKLISSCIQDHMDKSVAPPQSHLVHTISNLFLPEKPVYEEKMPMNVLTNLLKNSSEALSCDKFSSEEAKLAEISEKDCTKMSSENNLVMDKSTANFAAPVNLDCNEPVQEPKENGTAKVQTCTEPSSDDVAESCKKMCEIACKCLDVIFSDLSDPQSSSANGFSDMMSTCLDVIFPQDGMTEAVPNSEDIPEMVENCLDALLTPSAGNEELTSRCMRLLSECSDDSDFIVFDGGDCLSDSSDEDDWTDSDCEDDEEEEPEDDPLREADRKWNAFYGLTSADPSDNPSKVRFDPVPKIHTLRTWDFASRAARIGPWEQAGRDRVRFAQRIQRTEAELSTVLAPAHRKKVWRRMHMQTQLPSS